MFAEQQRDESLNVAVAKPGFVSISRFVIANGMEKEVKSAFLGRPHCVEQASGFLRMDVLSPLDAPSEIWVMTFWTDAESFHRWHHSHVFHESHEGIPKGLKLVSGAQKMQEFEHVCS